MIEPKVVLTGVAELDNALSYMHTIHANKVARLCISAGLRKAASNIRRHIKTTIRPRTADKGIGWRLKRATRKHKTEGKAGVAVGRAFREAAKMTGPRAIGKGKAGRKKLRKGVGISSANLHWFALGTKKRYTKAKPLPAATGLISRISRILRSPPKGRYTGMIRKEKFGGFVQSFGQSSVTQRMIDVARKSLSNLDSKGIPGAMETAGVLGGD